MGRRKKEPQLKEGGIVKEEKVLATPVVEKGEILIEAKYRERVFSELKETVDKTVTAFAMAAKENRELAFRIIASKKELERISKRLN